MNLKLNIINQDKLFRFFVLCYNKSDRNGAVTPPGHTDNLISAGSGNGHYSMPRPPLPPINGGFLMGARQICDHGVTPKSSCRLCHNEIARQSARKNYDPIRNREKYLANRYAQLARCVNQNARKYGAPGIVTAEIYRRLVNGSCDYCGLKGLPMEIDHKIPLSKGGTNEVSNLHGVCRYCNTSKGRFGEDEFLYWLEAVRKSA